jgi:protein-tyrosine phosphatase
MSKEDSQSPPIRVDFVPGHSLPGRIGMTFAPGKYQSGMYAEWCRDLETDLARLCEEYETHTLVCLLEDHELVKVEIEKLPTAARNRGLEFIHFPIRDMGVPADQRATADLIARICDVARAGETVVIHCMGGFGRTGTIAASCLVALGDEAASAIERVRAGRRGAIENSTQEEFVHAMANNLASGE